MTKPGPGEEKINPTDDGDAGVDVLKQPREKKNLELVRDGRPHSGERRAPKATPGRGGKTGEKDSKKLRW